jgi:hypothetical protein
MALSCTMLVLMLSLKATKVSEAPLSRFNVLTLTLLLTYPVCVCFVYSVSHALSSDIFNGCWYDAYMPPRSLVFQSKATTILSHSVISTDLETGAEEWRVNLDEGLNKTNTTCWGYWLSLSGMCVGVGLLYDY